MVIWHAPFWPWPISHCKRFEQQYAFAKIHGSINSGVLKLVLWEARSDMDLIETAILCSIIELYIRYIFVKLYSIRDPSTKCFASRTSQMPFPYLVVSEQSIIAKYFWVHSLTRLRATNAAQIAMYRNRNYWSYWCPNSCYSCNVSF